MQATQIGTAILQHRLVLDYLLAEQGRGCGKFNDSNCYLQTDDSGEVGKRITSGIRKLAHIPVQTWNGWDFDMWSWFPGGPRTKRALHH